MRFQTLEQWLAWQETLHPRKIDPGLERVAQVARVMGLDRPPFAVITVAGTNGKGSCVALLESVLRAAGYRVGAYFSPHLLRYNERVRVCGAEVSDRTLCEAFERVDQARGETTLSYFEFGTLAAIDIFFGAGLDVAVLEVGMGGRLDAVNVLDADAALVASVGIDHVIWLGHDRDSIGREKAGIFRAGRPAVYGDPDPPRSVLEHARSIAAPLYCQGRDFGYAVDTRGWNWWGGERTRDALPYPALLGDYQFRNAAAVLMVLEQLRERLPVGQDDVRRGLQEVRLSGRFQVVPGAVERIFDVAHNLDAARVLAQALLRRPCRGRTRAVIGMLGDKDVEGVGRVMSGGIDVWYAAGLDGERGIGAEALAARLQSGGVSAPVQVCHTVSGAYERAMQEARTGDRVVVFGSFHTVAEVLRRGL